MWLKDLIAASGAQPKQTSSAPDNRIVVDGECYAPEEASLIRRTTFEFDGIGNVVNLSGSTWIDGNLRFVFRGSNNKAALGQNGYVGSDTYIIFYPAGPGTECTGSSLQLGDRFKLNGSSIHLEIGEPDTAIVIGDDFMCASGVRMETSDSHAIFDFSSRQRINLPGSIGIGHHVWLCRDVMVMNHARIPSQTVVAARSIVNKKFDEEYTLLAGAPAVVKRRDVVWTFELDAQCPQKNL